MSPNTSVIPFIRVLPGLRSVLQLIETSQETAIQARRFLRQGGRYKITIKDDATVEMVAVVPVENDKLYAQATCHNDPGLPQAVEYLVADSIKTLTDRARHVVVN